MTLRSELERVMKDWTSSDVNFFIREHGQALLEAVDGWVLDAPALVGNIQFGKGIPWSAVIACAQRRYQHKDDLKPTIEEIARFHQVLDAARGDA